MPEELRLGMIGLDTSHSVEFTRRLNDPANPQHIPGARVVHGFPEFSPDMSWSVERVKEFTRELEEQHGVLMLGSIAEVVAESDAILLCSLDGRKHLAQVEPVFAAKKPVFVDKPVAATLKDVVSLYELAAESETPCFSASAMRWYPGIIGVAQADVGAVRGAISYGPSPLEPNHPDLFFYGIHPTEALFTVLGSGCQRVQRVTTPHTSVVTGMWEDGKVGTLHAIHRWPAEYKVTKFGDTGIFEQKEAGDYTPMLREIVKFFQTRKAPVTMSETLEIYCFMEAADESRRWGGTSVELSEVLARASE
ncbi:Gfo/Idh/MocA family oxidoreductase [Roseimicrobium sp. ORNL1]|uniref:Gfo/Idh/MocA family protein n=1 Tax=Roseimicrobium sp. ORNL1 TaxID=2711231 RepID=UPI0013E13F20|nr:Gfo/Idh/MocA family oxidoreductase [Roseimicrobium sp. ORNL1]QIF00452.1 Gfo/Idh/MocA family oxidoreductase [Roseimicrobium sp. ORNL1]